MWKRFDDVCIRLDSGRTDGTELVTVKQYCALHALNADEQQQ